MKTVNWSNYADVYDMISDNNPAYQDITKDFQTEIASWDITSDESILDIGAGTGNFTLLAALKFPKSRIHHLDSCQAMSNHALLKSQNKKANNIEYHHTSVENVDWTLFKNVKAVVCVHALYPLNNPHEIIKKIYEILKPGGYVYLCDVGRIINIFAWRKFLISHLWQQYGLKKTLQILLRSRQVSKQNKRVRDLQKNGIYWTHTHQEFLNAVKSVGFDIIRNDVVFKGDSDLVVAVKPAN